MTDAIDQWTGMVWSRLQDAGHLDCGGWSYDHYDVDLRGPVVVCRCGTRIKVEAPPQ